MTGQLQISLFGSFRLVRNGSEISAKDWQTRQARQLFKLLLTERGHLVSAGKLLDLLWPEHVEHADKALRSAVSALRDVLEPGREPWMPSHFIPRGRQGYVLIFPDGWDVWVDSYEFECLLDTYLEGVNTPETRAQLEQALQLYTGDYLTEDGDASWVLAERSRLRERYFAGVMRLLKWQGDTGLYDEAIALGRRALAVDVCREPLYRCLMQYQALVGDTAAALQTFERCRQALDDYLGADPSPQTLELHMAILQREFPQPMPAVPAVIGEDRFLARQGAPFIGRRSELHWLTQQLLAMRPYQQGGRTSAIAVVGEAGVGKSSLMRHFLQQAGKSGVVTLSTICQALEQDIAFASLLSLLKAWIGQVSDEQLAALPTLTRAWLVLVLPELALRLPDLAPLPAGQPELAYSLLVNRWVDLFVSLCSSQPLVLAFDDLQWADAATLQVLNRLGQVALHQGQNYPFLLLISYHSEDISENERLSGILHALRRENCLQTLQLNGFTLDEIAEFLQTHHAPPYLSPEAIHQATRGNALFLVEVLHTLPKQREQWEGRRKSSDSPGEQIVSSALLTSQAIRDVVFGRVERLPRRAIDFVELASVIAHPFPPALLASVLLPEDYRMLDILLKRGFLVESSAPGKDGVQVSLSHEVVGKIISASCSAVHLSYLHSHVAEQMERFYAANIGPHAAEIALHYRQAGLGKELQTLRYTLQAAEYARRTFRFHLALKHYGAALHLLQQQADSLREEWLDKVYRGQSLVYEALLDWKGIQENYRSVSSWATSKHDLVLANNSLYRMIVARSLMGYCTEAADMGRRFIDLLKAESERLSTVPEQIQESVRLQMDLTRRWTQIQAFYDSEDMLQLQGSSSQLPTQFPPFSSAVSPAVANWERAGEILGSSQSAVILTTYGWALHLQGFIGDAERCLLAARKEAGASEQVVWWILASLHLSRVYFSQGQFKQGVQEFERCLKRCKQVTEAPWLPVWPMLNQAYYLMNTGHLEEAERLFLLLLEQQLASQDLPSYRYSAQIGLGLLTLARGHVEHARTQLCSLLAKKQNMYIETYVFAEVGLAEIDMQQGAYTEAYQRLYSMLALTGKRGLLELYTICACTLARLSLAHTQQAQGVVPLLKDVHQRISTIGPNHLSRECSTLLAQFSENWVC